MVRMVRRPNLMQDLWRRPWPDRESVGGQLDDVKLLRRHEGQRVEGMDVF